MNDLINKVVKWKHPNSTLKVRGHIVAIAGLDSMSRFRLCVQSEDGSLMLYDYSDLIVGPELTHEDEVITFYADEQADNQPVLQPIFFENSELDAIQFSMDTLGFPRDSDVFDPLLKTDMPGAGMVTTIASRACFLLKSLFAELSEAEEKIALLEAKKKPGRPKKDPEA